MNGEVNQGENKQEPVIETVNIELSEEIAKEITKPIIYTEEFVKKEVATLLEESKNEELLTIGRLFENKAYSSQRLSEWAEKFKNNDEISESIKKIKDIFLNRINDGALRGKFNPTMTIFNLKNNYNWKDKNETDITTKGESLNNMSYERAKGIITGGKGSDKSNSPE